MSKTTYNVTRRRRAIGIFILMSSILIGFARHNRGEQPPQPSAEERICTGAFLDLDDSALGALLERSLLKNEHIQWVERAEIDSILSERELTLLMEPGASGERSAIGRILKADLLVLLRHSDDPTDHFRLVVCETEYGLRLTAHTMIATDQLASDARQLSSLVDRAIERHAQEVIEVCAVPPFVTHDLVYDYDHMKITYARLVEQSLRDRAGLVTVELEEGKSIADELDLTGGQVRRRLPLYFLGQFRHHGTDEQLTADLSLDVKRGDQMLARRIATGLPVSKIPSFLRQSTTELLEEAIGVRAAASETQLEAKQLARQADTFYKLGSWAEAAALAEASLLLDGEQPPMREVAASALGYLARHDSQVNSSPQAVGRAIRYQLRAMEHFEILLKDVRHLDGSKYSRLSSHIRWLMIWNEYRISPGLSEEVVRVVESYRSRHLEIFLRIVRTRCREHKRDVGGFMAGALTGLSDERQARILLQVVTELPVEPESTRLAKSLLTQGSTIHILNTPERRKLIAHLAELDHQYVAKAAIELQDKLQEELARQPSQATTAARKPSVAPVAPSAPALEPLSEQRVHFEPIQIILDDAHHEYGPISTFASCIPAGPGIDFVWELNQHLYVMKEPGKLKKIWDAGYPQSKGTRITDARFDGQFVWVTLEPGIGPPKLLIVDPKTEQTWKFGQRQGLPVVDDETVPDRHVLHRLWAVPIERGRALLVSYFGRMALAWVDFDPSGRVKVDVFFHARLKKSPIDRGQNDDPHLAFEPNYLYALQGQDQGKAIRRVLIGGRGGHDDHPLIIDPETSAVTVCKYPFLNSNQQWEGIATESAVYHWAHQSGKPRLLRQCPPDFVPRSMAEDPPSWKYVVSGGRFFAVGHDWWELESQAGAGKHLRRMATNLPWSYPRVSGSWQDYSPDDTSPAAFELEMFCHSNHYGLIAVRRHCRRHRSEFFRVVIESQR